MKLEIKKLYKRYHSREVLEEISLSCNFQALGLIGPSGGGKSTLLRVIGGLAPPDQGEILLDGTPVPYADEKQLLNYRRSLGVVFQSWNLFPHLTAMENITLPLCKVHQIPLERAIAMGKELLSRFELLSHAHKKPHELSGGQCQRVAIIRAVAIRPLLLLLDEPTSALDPVMTSEVLDLLFELKNEGIAFIIVSHHLPFLQKAADQIAFIDQGKLIESGETAGLFKSSKQPQVVDYLRKVYKY